MAKVDYTSIVIPSNAKDRVILTKCMEEVINSKARAQAETALQKDVFERIKTEYNIPKDIVNTWINEMIDPEKRSVSEAKQELIESGRVALIDQATANREHAAGMAAADFDPASLQSDADRAKEMETKRLADAAKREQEEQMKIEAAMAEKEAKEAEALNVQTETPKEPEPEPVIDVLDEIDTLEEPVVKEPTPTEDKVTDDFGDMFAESAAGLGDMPTDEDFAAVNAAADAQAAESEEDLFGDLDTVDTKVEPVVADSIADDDDIFAGLDDLSFDEPTKTEEPAPLDVADDLEIDDIFADLM